MQRYYGEMLLLIVTILASVGWFFSKYAIAQLPPVGFIGLRFIIATLLFLPFCYKQLRQFSRRDLAKGTLVGLLFTLQLLFWVLAIAVSNALGEGAFIMSLAMLVAPIIGWLLLKQKPHNLFWLALPLSLMGLYLISQVQGQFSWDLGSIFFLLSALCMASFFVLNNQFAKQLPSLALTTLLFATVGIGCSLYSLCFETWAMPISTSTWGWLMASVFIATNFRYLLQTMGQKYCNITSGAIIMMCEPIWTLLLSLLLLGEYLSWQKVLGCLLILASLLLYRLPILLKMTHK